MGQEAGIRASRLEFGLRSWDLGLKAWSWDVGLLRLGYEPQGQDMVLKARVGASSQGGDEEEEEEEEEEEPVAQGQYVVSDTRCPALRDCEFE